LAAQPKLAERPNVHFVMAGEGPWFEKIRNIVDLVGLVHRIHLLGFRADVPNVLRGCDLFILPTHQEALGQSYIEAMAPGLPVIGTNVDGVPEVITHGVNGLLVPPHDINALRAAITRLVDGPELTAKLGEAGRLLTDVNFTIDSMADGTIDLYRRGISERRSRL
jgi:glycosyltransferase involved in cell wall biosynthesis